MLGFLIQYDIGLSGGIDLAQWMACFILLGSAHIEHWRVDWCSRTTSPSGLKKQGGVDSVARFQD
jgi:hypothetical protein